MFSTQYDRAGRTHCRSGSRLKKLFEPSFDDDGVFCLVESGTADLYDEIQSFKDSVDINVLLKRYQEGDLTALERAQSFYGDVTGVPKTYSGMLNAMLNSRNIFDSLPLEVRANFDHSFEKFVSAMDDPSFYAQLISKAESKSEVKKEDIVDEQER